MPSSVIFMDATPVFRFATHTPLSQHLIRDFHAQRCRVSWLCASFFLLRCCPSYGCREPATPVRRLREGGAAIKPEALRALKIPPYGHRGFTL